MVDGVDRDAADNVVPFRRSRVLPNNLLGHFPRIDIVSNDEGGGFIVGIVFGHEEGNFIICGVQPTFPSAVSLARHKAATLEPEWGRLQVVDFTSFDWREGGPPEDVA